MKMGKENLVVQLQLHNEKALEYLVLEHGERLISIIRKHLFTLPHLQQECLKRTVQDIWDYVEFFQEENEFENWIGSVARYCCLEFLQNHREEATIAWLIEKEIAEEEEMMISCLRPEEQELFVRFYRGEAVFSGDSGTVRTYRNIYELLNCVETDIFEYEKEPLSLQERQEVLQSIHFGKKEKKHWLSLRRFFKAAKIQLSEVKSHPYFPQKFFLYERR